MQYLIPSNKENIFTISVCIGALSNFVLNLILIPRYHAIGAAIASVSAESIIAIYQLIIIKKEIKFLFILKQNIKCIVSAFIMFVIQYYVEKQLICNNVLKLIILTVSGALIYLIFLLLFRYKLLTDLFFKKYIYSINSVYLNLKKKETKINKNLSKIYILLSYHFFKPAKISSMLKLIKTDKRDSKISESNVFNYYIDTKCVPLIKYPMWNNFTPDYEKVLNNSFLQFKGKSNSFKESLERILLLNQLFWQAGHKLVGLGRLDYLLHEYYKNDLNKNLLNDEKALIYVKEFLKCLHKYYEFKSSVMNGDTGQIIILGGCDFNNHSFNSNLTLLFMQAFYELRLPDPKFVFRYSENTSEKIFNYAVKCLTNNCGSPVFCSDKLIINAMNSYGYDPNDTWNYCFSACWEPLIPGKSRDVNNYYTLNLLEPVSKVLIQQNDINYENFCSKYFEHIQIKCNEIKEKINNCIFEKSEIFDLFVEDKYKYFGITVSGFINCVKCFVNIKNQTLNNTDFIYTEKDFIDTADYIFNTISKMIYPVKIGTSSPSYLNFSKKTLATPDGRKDFDPFEIHISDSKAKDYSSILIFASKLNYNNNRFNGNVTDILLTSNELNNNLQKITQIIRTALETGVFQIQVNVLDYNTLIKAKQNPHLYPDLIVRVWGFSAYFNDLPEEYKDYVIERARNHENY
jgi:formate C-acetyltransferase